MQTFGQVQTFYLRFFVRIRKESVDIMSNIQPNNRWQTIDIQKNKSDFLSFLTQNLSINIRIIF